MPANLAEKAVDVYNILIESDNELRQPVRLETQLLKHMTMDAEVGQSMLQLLQVSQRDLQCCTYCSQAKLNSTCCHSCRGCNTYMMSLQAHSVALVMTHASMRSRFWLWVPVIQYSRNKMRDTLTVSSVT